MQKENSESFLRLKALLQSFLERFRSEKNCLFLLMEIADFSPAPQEKCLIESSCESFLLCVIEVTYINWLKRGKNIF